MPGPDPKVMAHFAKAHRVFGKGQTCLLSIMSTCTNGAINSHSISKSCLKSIAEEGHLASIEINHFANSIDELFKIREFGINQASTFVGFCATHDNSLFAPIDAGSHKLSERNAAIYFLRAVAHELWLKYKTTSALRSVSITDLDLNPDQLFEGLKDGFLAGARDLQIQFIATLSEIENQDTSKWKYISIELPYQIPVSYAAPLNFDVFPEYVKAPLTANQFAPSILISLTPMNGVSRLVLSWRGAPSLGMKTFLKRVEKSKNNLPEFLFQFGLEHIENIYFTPSWFNEIKSEFNNEIMDLIRQNTNPFENCNLSARPLRGALSTITLKDCLMTTNTTTGRQLFKRLKS